MFIDFFQYSVQKTVQKLSFHIKRWISDESAAAAAEAGLIFPILLTLLLGTFDMGNGILANQKSIRASQVIADLVTRSQSITLAGLDDAIEAGRLAYSPLPDGSFGVDIVSIRFDDDAQPQIVWRETRNMAPLGSALTDVEALAEPGNGVVMVVVEYNFEPLFAGFIVDAIPMQEKAFARGRRSPVVTLE